jgi:hypothetical protein
MSMTEDETRPAGSDDSPPTEPVPKINGDACAAKDDPDATVRVERNRRILPDLDNQACASAATAS